MQVIRLILVLGFLLPTVLHAQFAPQAGLPGSTAIHKDSSIIKAWPYAHWFSAGWLNVNDLSLGAVSGINSPNALGYPDGQVISLGDMGNLTYFFENPIVDSAGYDFAIFENGFRNPLDSNLAFLELAFVEVSNDGVNYVRFPATCHNDTTAQIPGSGVYMDARKINNLAGKYISGYGTPFDLSELAFSSSLQLDNIRYVRLVDVVGTIQPELCSRDKDLHIINDPFPTPFNTGGFDLDALGIIHQKYPTSVHQLQTQEPISIYPNPVMDEFRFLHDQDIRSVSIRNTAGQIVRNIHDYQPNTSISLAGLPSSVYQVIVTLSHGEQIRTKLVKW